MAEGDPKLRAARAFHAAHLAPRHGPPVGAPAAGIAAAEAALGLPLAPAHRAFLRWAGADRRGALRGSDWFLRDLAANAALLPDLLAENGLAPDAAEGAVCFFSHQGYMAAWYMAGGPDPDPPCLFFSEGGGPPAIRPAGRFSAFLTAELRGAAGLPG